MGQPIEITNLEYAAAELRRLASWEKRGEAVRRLLALAVILEGHSRTEAAEMNGMDRQTLPDWVHRDNAAGLAGLISLVGLGPASLMSEAKMAELRALVVNGPDPEVHRLCVGGASIFKSRCLADFRLRQRNVPSVVG